VATIGGQHGGDAKLLVAAIDGAELRDKVDKPTENRIHFQRTRDSPAIGGSGHTRHADLATTQGRSKNDATSFATAKLQLRPSNVLQSQSTLGHGDRKSSD